MSLHLLTDVLMEDGVGRPYFNGNKRKLWCNESMASIRARAGRLKKSETTDTPAAAKSQVYLRALATNPANRVTNGGKPRRREHDRKN